MQEGRWKRWSWIHSQRLTLKAPGLASDAAAGAAASGKGGLLPLLGGMLGAAGDTLRRCCLHRHYLTHTSCFSTNIIDTFLTRHFSTMTTVRKLHSL